MAIVTPAQASNTLNSYIVQVQRLLHDTSGQFFTTPQLTEYINDARDKVALDSMCVRMLQPFTLIAGQESYQFSAFPQSTSTIGVLGMNVIDGSLKYPTTKVSFAFLSARTRAYVGLTDRPVMFAIYGENKMYVGVTPDQAYPVELDTSVLPTDLVDNTTVEQIPVNWTVAVAYYAAYLAKQYQQMWAEADSFRNDYTNRLKECRAGSMQRMVGNIYSART